jgi:hypothetical protein
MNRRGQMGFFIFILFMILAIAVVLVIIFISGRDEPLQQPELNITVNKTYYNITVSSNANTKIEYVLSNSTAILVNGMLFPNMIEDYKLGIEANTTVLLEGFSGEYYYNSTICNITYNKFPCRVNLKPKALDYVVTLYNDSVVIDPKGGIIQAPVLLCWIERANVLNVRMNLNITKTPLDQTKFVDFCYIIPDDIKIRKSYRIDVRKNEFNNVTDLLKVRVRDYEKSGYPNIGDKDAGVLI